MSVLEQLLLLMPRGEGVLEANALDALLNCPKAWAIFTSAKKAGSLGGEQLTEIVVAVAEKHRISPGVLEGALDDLLGIRACLLHTSKHPTLGYVLPTDAALVEDAGETTGSLVGVDGSDDETLPIDLFDGVYKTLLAQFDSAGHLKQWLDGIFKRGEHDYGRVVTVMLDEYGVQLMEAIKQLGHTLSTRHDHSLEDNDPLWAGAVEYWLTSDKYLEGVPLPDDEAGQLKPTVGFKGSKIRQFCALDRFPTNSAAKEEFLRLLAACGGSLEKLRKQLPSEVPEVFSGVPAWTTVDGMKRGFENKSDFPDDGSNGGIGGAGNNPGGADPGGDPDYDAMYTSFLTCFASASHAKKSVMDLLRDECGGDDFARLATILYERFTNSRKKPFGDSLLPPDVMQDWVENKEKLAGVEDLDDDGAGDKKNGGDSADELSDEDVFPPHDPETFDRDELTYPEKAMWRFICHCGGPKRAHHILFDLVSEHGGNWDSVLKALRESRPSVFRALRNQGSTITGQHLIVWDQKIQNNNPDEMPPEYHNLSDIHQLLSTVTVNKLDDILNTEDIDGVQFLRKLTDEITSIEVQLEDDFQNVSDAFDFLEGPEEDGAEKQPDEAAAEKLGVKLRMYLECKKIIISESKPLDHVV
ncbi:MAG: hypothetical protein ABIJ92_01160 [Candidatus Aenigmatarchaeota archaeon]